MLLDSFKDWVSDKREFKQDKVNWLLLSESLFPFHKELSSLKKFSQAEIFKYNLINNDVQVESNDLTDEFSRI